MKSSILIVLALGFAGFGALEVAALNPTGTTNPSLEETDAIDDPVQAASSQMETVDQNQTGLKAGLEDLSDSSSDVAAATCLTPALVAAFEPRHKAMEARSAKLDQREAELKELESTISARLTDMNETHVALQAMTERLDVVAGEDITHLVDMYSTMKPKKAAAIFDRMDPAFAAGFIREIDSARAGVIMAEMGEEQSYRVSLLIANRHAEWRNR